MNKARQRREAEALSEALCAWRDALTERGVFKAGSPERRALAYRHDNVVISYMRTAPTIEVK